MGDEFGEFFGEDDLFGDTDPIGDDEAIEDNRYNGGEGGAPAINDFLKNDKKTTASARKKTNPRALLNERSLLLPDTGLLALRKEFKNYKPDTSRDPYATLQEVLKKYQHWAHVLAPRMKFEDSIARCEALGAKRPVRVFMDKIRLGIPLCDDDFAPTSIKSAHKTAGVHGLITTEYASDDDNGDRRSDFGDDEEMAGGKAIEKEDEEEAQKAAPRSLFGSSKTWSSAPKETQSSQPAPAPLSEEERRRVAENRIRALELRAKREAEARGEAPPPSSSGPTTTATVPPAEAPVIVSQPPPQEDVSMVEYEEEFNAPRPEDFMDEDEIMAQFDDFE